MGLMEEIAAQRALSKEVRSLNTALGFLESTLEYKTLPASARNSITGAISRIRTTRDSIAKSDAQS